LTDLEGYHAVENFLKKLNQTDEFYIDSKANEIPYQGGSLAQKLLSALDAYQQGKNSSTTGIPDDPIIGYTVSLITAARLFGLVKDRQDVMQKLKETEDRLGECTDNNSQLRNKIEELQRRLKEPTRKDKRYKISDFQ
jgi:predicted RNase H-like nuclease (RuvC/YqgF family)